MTPDQTDRCLALLERWVVAQKTIAARTGVTQPPFPAIPPGLSWTQVPEQWFTAVGEQFLNMTPNTTSHKHGDKQ